MDVASGIVGIAAVGVNLSTSLYLFASSVADADKDMTEIASDVALTSSVLHNVGNFLSETSTASVASSTAVEDAYFILDRCKAAFGEIQTLIDKNSKTNPDGTKKFGARAKVMWPLRSSRADLLKRRLESLKSSLMLLLQVLSFAKDQAKGTLEKQAMLEKRESIHVLHRRREEALANVAALEKSLEHTTLEDAGGVYNSEPSRHTHQLPGIQSFDHLSGVTGMQYEYINQKQRNDFQQNYLAGQPTGRHTVPPTLRTSIHAPRLTTEQIAAIRAETVSLLNCIHSVEDTLKTRQDYIHLAGSHIESQYREFSKTVEALFLENRKAPPPPPPPSTDGQAKLSCITRHSSVGQPHFAKDFDFDGFVAGQPCVPLNFGFTSANSAHPKAVISERYSSNLEELARPKGEIPAGIMYGPLPSAQPMQQVPPNHSQNQTSGPWSKEKDGAFVSAEMPALEINHYGSAPTGFKSNEIPKSYPSSFEGPPLLPSCFLTMPATTTSQQNFVNQISSQNIPVEEEHMAMSYRRASPSQRHRRRLMSDGAEMPKASESCLTNSCNPMSQPPSEVLGVPATPASLMRIPNRNQSPNSSYIPFSFEWNPADLVPGAVEGGPAFIENGALAETRFPASYRKADGTQRKKRRSVKPIDPAEPGLSAYPHSACLTPDGVTMLPNNYHPDPPANRLELQPRKSLNAASTPQNQTQAPIELGQAEFAPPSGSPLSPPTIYKDDGTSYQIGTFQTLDSTGKIVTIKLPFEVQVSSCMAVDKTKLSGRARFERRKRASGLHGRGIKRAREDEGEALSRGEICPPEMRNPEVDILDQLLARWTTVSLS